MTPVSVKANADGPMEDAYDFFYVLTLYSLAILLRERGQRVGGFAQGLLQVQAASYFYLTRAVRAGQTALHKCDQGRGFQTAKRDLNGAAVAIGFLAN